MGRDSDARFRTIGRGHARDGRCGTARGRHRRRGADGRRGRARQPAGADVRLRRHALRRGGGPRRQRSLLHQQRAESGLPRRHRRDHADPPRGADADRERPAVARRRGRRRRDRPERRLGARQRRSDVLPRARRAAVCSRSRRSDRRLGHGLAEPPERPLGHLDAAREPRGTRGGGQPRRNRPRHERVRRPCPSGPHARRRRGCERAARGVPVGAGLDRRSIPAYPGQLPVPGLPDRDRPRPFSRRRSRTRRPCAGSRSRSP